MQDEEFNKRWGGSVETKCSRMDQVKFFKACLPQILIEYFVPFKTCVRP